MKKQYQYLKLMSLTFIFIFLFEIVAIANPLLETTIIEPIATDDTLPEVIDRREESIKTFQKENGNYVAVIYGEAVHYQDKNGHWQEIDNFLIPTTQSIAQLAENGVNVANTAEAPIAYHKNVANSIEVYMPNILKENTPITVNYQGKTLGLSLQGVDASGGDMIAQIDNVSSKTAAQKHGVSLTRKNGIISYGQVLPDVQLVYELRGKKLKENLIFRAPPTQEDFVFNFYYEDLYPKLLSSGEVQFFSNIEKDGEPTFVVFAPYISDAGEGYCTDVSVELIETSNGCLYKLTPNKSWLNAEERIYPVTLSPSVSTPLTQTLIHDNSVHESDPTVNYINADRLYVGSVVLNSGVFESRTYIKFPRATQISTVSFIVNATMVLTLHTNMSYQSGNNNEIYVYDCGDNAWGTSNITWNTQKNFEFNTRVASGITNKTNSVECFDVTSLVRRWYKTTDPNNGLVIIPRTVHTDVSNRTGYFSSDISSSMEESRPHIEIEYRNYKIMTVSNYYDSAYRTRYSGTGEDAPGQKILTYANYYKAYMREMFGLTILNGVKHSESDQDRCTHGATNLNSFCNKRLYGTCNYSAGRYHCTNATYQFEALPTGVSWPTTSERIIKWTGHRLCENCPDNGHTPVIGASTASNMISINWGNDLTPDEYDEVSVGTIAHEMGHTFGCLDGGNNIHNNNTCAVKSGVIDRIKYLYIVDLNSEAYCENCHEIIQNYIENNL